MADSTFPHIGFNPIVEFNAQETSIDVDKVATFFHILEEETNKMHENAITRSLEAGLTLEEILSLLLSMVAGTGFEQVIDQMLIVEEPE